MKQQEMVEIGWRVRLNCTARETLFRGLRQKESNMNVMKVLGRTGDTEFKWDPRTGEGLRGARRVFEEKRRRGYLAFVEGPHGEGSNLIQNFDPHAESIILAPRLVGG